MDKIQELREKIAKDPSSKLFLPLAEEYRKAGMLDEAIGVLAQGIEHQPKYTSAIVALGKIYFEKKMFKEAKAELEKVVKTVPDNLFAQRKLADIYKELGDRDMAVNQYRRVLKLNPLDEEAQSILEGLLKPAAPKPKEEAAPAMEVAEEDVDFLLSLTEEAGERALETEKLTPIEEFEAEAELEAEATPVGEAIEVVDEVEAIAELESVDEIDDALEAVSAEEEFLEAFEDSASMADLAEMAAEAAEAVEVAGEAEEADEEFEAVGAIEVPEGIEVAELTEAVAVSDESAVRVEPAEEMEPIAAEKVVFEEVGFSDLSYTDREEAGNEQLLAQEYVSKGQYAKALNVYNGMLRRDPKNLVAKQGLQELQALIKLIGSEKEVIIARLEAYLGAVMKRKNEFYRNA